MAKKKLALSLKIIMIIGVIFFSKIVFSDSNDDQWQDSDKSYKDLINDGFEVKAYSINNIEILNGLKILLFVTVLQKDTEIFECQEYQTIDKMIETLDMQLICKELVQPYERGLGT